MDQSSVARYENEQVQIPDPHKRQLAARFGVSVSHLMGWDDDEATRSENENGDANGNGSKVQAA